MRNEFLYPHDVVLVVVVGIEIGHIVFSALEHHEDMLALVELAEQSAVVVVVETVHVGIEPHLPATQRTVSVALQRDAVHRVFRQYVSHCRSALHEDFREILLYEYVLEFRRRVERHFDYLCLTVRIGCKIVHS